MAEYIITTAVGTGEKGFAGDGGPADAALLNGPFDIAFDAGGNLYFSDTFNNRIRRVDARSGVISTVAGNGDKGFSGDGGPATGAALNEPYGIALDRAGNIFVADRLNRRVRRIDAASGIITTLAGTGEAAYGGDGGPAAGAGLAEPNGLAFDAGERHLYITDVADNRVRIVDLARGRSRHLPAPARPSTAAMAARPLPPEPSAPARSRSAPTARSISSSARAAVCGRSIRGPGSSRRSPAPPPAATAAMAARRSPRCSMRPRKWRSTATAA